MRNFIQQTPSQSFCAHHFPPFSILSEQVDASREASRASMIGYFNPEPPNRGAAANMTTLKDVVR